MNIIDIPNGCALWHDPRTGELYLANDPEGQGGYMSRVHIGTCTLKDPSVLPAQIALLAPWNPRDLGMAAAGEKVRFLAKNGMPYELKRALEQLDEGHILTVKRVKIGRSSSSYTFVELPGETFNTVMFRPIV